jgi:putative (di)nucleoside polyphosphate hydrolase
MSSKPQAKRALGKNVFRAGVGAVITNAKGRVLAFERVNVPGAWQLPQGGLEADEEPMEAVFREVEEETGIAKKSLRLLAEYPEWLAYELDKSKQGGKHGRGQVQKWFLFRFKGLPEEIRPEKAHEVEFSRWKWTSFTRLAKETVPFRRVIYKKLAVGFRRFLK